MQQPRGGMDDRPRLGQCRTMPAARPFPRLAVRGLLLIDNRLLPGPMRGVAARAICSARRAAGWSRNSSLPENLMREFHEETGLTVAVGTPCLVNEFHAPRARLSSGRYLFPRDPDLR